MTDATILLAALLACLCLLCVARIVEIRRFNKWHRARVRSLIAML